MQRSELFKFIKGKWCLTYKGWNKVMGGYIKAPRPLECLTRSQLTRAKNLWDVDEDFPIDIA